MDFKGCERCRGDLYREEDIGQTDLVCLQCGYRKPEDDKSTIITSYRTRRKAGSDRQPVQVAA